MKKRCYSFASDAMAACDLMSVEWRGGSMAGSCTVYNKICDAWS